MTSKLHRFVTPFNFFCSLQRVRLARKFESKAAGIASSREGLFDEGNLFPLRFVFVRLCLFLWMYNRVYVPVCVGVFKRLNLNFEVTLFKSDKDQVLFDSPEPACSPDLPVLGD